MFSSFVDPAHGLVTVAQLLPVPGTALFTLLMPGGRVFSCQPGGFPGDRDPGFDGDWERCRIVDNLATFLVDGRYFTFAFVLVDGLT